MSGEYKYVLKNKRVTPEPDVVKWSRWWTKAYESEEHIVKQTTLKDGTWVSTVFLGVDPLFGLLGKPSLIFETMVFRSKDYFREKDMSRSATWTQALKEHNKMVRKWKTS